MALSGGSNPSLSARRQTEPKSVVSGSVQLPFPIPDGSCIEHLNRAIGLRSASVILFIISRITIIYRYKGVQLLRPALQKPTPGSQHTKPALQYLSWFLPTLRSPALRGCVAAAGIPLVNKMKLAAGHGHRHSSTRCAPCCTPAALI